MHPSDSHPRVSKIKSYSHPINIVHPKKISYSHPTNIVHPKKISYSHPKSNKKTINFFSPNHEPCKPTQQKNEII